MFDHICDDIAVGESIIVNVGPGYATFIFTKKAGASPPFFDCSLFIPCNGTSGSSGSSGVNGTSGSSGSSGVNGTSGSSGSAGPGGASGTSGSSGTDGVISCSYLLNLLNTCNGLGINYNAMAPAGSRWS